MSVYDLTQTYTLLWKEVSLAEPRPAWDQDEHREIYLKLIPRAEGLQPVPWDSIHLIERDPGYLVISAISRDMHPISNEVHTYYDVDLFYTATDPRTGYALITHTGYYSPDPEAYRLVCRDPLTFLALEIL